MSVPSWADLEALFHEALARAPADRAVFLAERCAGRPDLRAEIEALLRAHDGATSSREGLPVTSPARLTRGVRVGPYEVLGELGAGGMGEVYRARDPKLGRDVAIKVLPALFLSDPERRARFEREARVLAALNHPNIAVIHGIEDVEGAPALVLELIDGVTLAERLAHPLPVTEALTIARQIADALEAAHDKGIVHRDLKPANIKITSAGVVKVLDFGLAKVYAGEGAAPDLSQAPTVSAGGTRDGMILGTPAYMSPEQARGQAVDKRADIWAFGCVLYETLTRRAAFPGETISDTIAAVLEREPDWSALPPVMPASIHRLLRRCLEKDPKRRLRDIGDVRIELDEALTVPVRPEREPSPVGRPHVLTRPIWKRALPIAAAAVLATALSSVAWWSVRSSSPPLPVTRLTFTLPEGQRLPIGDGSSTVAISPDGMQMFFVAAGRPYWRPYLRLMSQFGVKPIPWTDAAQNPNNPVFSPDGRSIAYSFHTGQLGFAIKRAAVSGGAPVTLCHAGFPLGMSWGADGIVFGERGRGIMRVSANGGTPELVVSVKAGEDGFRPQMLPGGGAVLFTLATGTAADRWDKAKIVVQSLPSGERKTLIDGGSDARYLPTGHLVYALGGTIFAVPFNLGRLEVMGEGVPLVDGVRRPTDAGGLTGSADFSVSDTGSLVYVSGAAPSVRRELAFIDRKGAVEPLKLPPDDYESPRISPDGTQIAYATDDGQEATVWISPLSGTGSARPLTFGGKNRLPIWSADGQHVAFQSDREGDLGIFWQRADGTGTAERLTTPDQGTSHVPESWLPKGEGFSFSAVNGPTASLWVFSLPDKKATPLGDIRSPFPLNSAWSPDGRWVAYTLRGATGASSVDVEPFPHAGTPYQISQRDEQGGHHPLWSPNGKELFYFRGTDPLVVVDIATQPTFSFSSPRPVPGPIANNTAISGPRNYDITPDGQRIITVVGFGQRQQEASTASQVQVVLNWFEELKVRVPAAK